MKSINIEKIAKQTGIRVTDIGRELFPKVHNPYQAIKRVIDGVSLLNTEQVVKLSDLTKIPIAELFTEE